MTDISIAPLWPSASRSVACSSSTAIATINGGVQYRPSGVCDAELATMTKAMHEHRRMIAAWQSSFGRVSMSASGSAFRLFRSHREYSTRQPAVGWLASFDRAKQVLGTLNENPGVRPAAARAIFADAFARQWLAMMQPAHSLNNN